MGEKEAGLATAREASTGIATGRELASGMPTGRAYATGDVDGDGMPDAAAAAVVKSKSNITNNREESPGSELDPEGMTRLNSSKSNAYRSASGTGDNDDAAAGGEPEAMASNLNLSKSNIDRSASGDDGGDGLPGSAESAIVKSKSNITNNREGETGGGDTGGEGLAIGDQGTNNEEKPRPHH